MYEHKYAVMQKINLLGKKTTLVIFNILQDRVKNFWKGWNQIFLDFILFFKCMRLSNKNTIFYWIFTPELVENQTCFLAFMFNWFITFFNDISTFHHVCIYQTWARSVPHGEFKQDFFDGGIFKKMWQISCQNFSFGGKETIDI